MNETQTLDLNKVSNYLGGDVTADSFIEAINTMNKVRAEIAKTGKTAIALLAKKLFEDAPEFTMIVWTQYAPYFNDGEACEFSIHEPSYGLSKELQALMPDPDSFFDDDYERDNGDEHRLISGWCLDSEYRWKKQGKDQPKRFKELREIANSFHSVLNSIEDICKEAFGDDSKVAIFPNGEVEITDYDHD